ncbi:putative membrane protein DUF2318 [Hydrogenispora ethanolica]|uniref:Putative membrane protein DUF2318 n=2 Tax=Hydrogenispora ethanolica TaxID=1082276 RepID=A0A4R1R8T4_HYDET|nr:putative membrane protein DUF2318 [Hydrogenispora ethanolica]
MGRSQQDGTMRSKRNWRGGYKIAGLVLALAGILAVWQGGVIRGETGDELRIRKSGVTGNARYYPYDAEGTKMEVIAVKASDGTIRTAFNTCQVCFNSGRGFYTQAGNELVCNNCGNRFKIDQIEKKKFGCNPIPILKENKREDGEYIIISGDYLAKHKKFFARWKN